MQIPKAKQQMRVGWKNFPENPISLTNLTFLGLLEILGKGQKQIGQTKETNAVALLGDTLFDAKLKRGWIEWNNSQLLPSTVGKEPPKWWTRSPGSVVDCFPPNDCSHEAECQACLSRC
jgi:hypothetical protein